MAMATTETTPEVSEEAVELWVKSYQGEVLGEAYFGHMAEHIDDPVHKAKLEVLTTLERCTKELLAPSMERLGISTVPDPTIAENVVKGTFFDYEGMINVLPGITGQYLGYYTRLRQLVEPRDASVVDLLIAHELALELFARREAAGELESSLEPIKALSHVTL
jgi:hypothetical protein